MLKIFSCFIDDAKPLAYHFMAFRFNGMKVDCNSFAIFDETRYNTLCGIIRKSYTTFCLNLF